LSLKLKSDAGISEDVGTTVAARDFEAIDASVSL
jgi:hypothetical protein